MSIIKPPRYISKQEITAIANRLIAQIRASDIPPKWPQVADRAADFLKLDIQWDRFDPADDGVVAAKIYPVTKEIYLNEAFPLIMDSSGFYQSTLAHEIGHWLLHVDLEDTGIPATESERERVFLCKSLDEQKVKVRHEKTPEEWREWQAQYFASCLLMPVDKLEEVRQGRNLTNWQHLKAISDELGVTSSNLCNRLQDLEYIQRVANSNRLYPGNRLKLANLA
jgi:IrrE N-terminal-like domain